MYRGDKWSPTKFWQDARNLKDNNTNLKESDSTLSLTRLQITQECFTILGQIRENYLNE